jgi:hypothetical protein
MAKRTVKTLVKQRLTRLAKLEQEGKKIKITTMLVAFVDAVNR